MKNPVASEYVLGLDLGAQSIGWALLSHKNGQPAGLLKLGARVFDAGVEGDIESGQDASRNVARRERRMARRMLQRRTRRLLKLAHILQRAGLLPKGQINAAPLRDRFFAELDKAIFRRHAAALPKGDPMRKTLAQLPYFLRSQALSERLSPEELGRALYHLAQRRGFLSNRKEEFEEDDGDKKKAKELGEVKKGIAELDAKMAEAHARTLGEYFGKLDPEKDRIRKRWTARRMYKDEFEAIWAAQAPHHQGVLADELKKDIHEAIFFQRPLKKQKFLVGACSCEPRAKRARWALIIAQRFRMLQRVNDLVLTDRETGEIRALTTEERGTLLASLETKGDMTFVQVRKLLGHKSYFFNLEEGGEKKLPGNRTAAKLIKVFGLERWNKFSPPERDRIVEDMLSLEDKADGLARRGREAWGLDAEAAQHFAHVVLEPDYCNLSTKAMKKLLPLLEGGTQYATARKGVYGEVVIRTAPVEALEGVNKVLPALRNPAVSRVLTELRALINSIVHEFGKPREIRIELARDLKKNRRDRQTIWKKNRENQGAREEAEGKIKDETRMENVKGADIEKVLLANECGWVCPYTDRPISMAALVGPTPQFDVEHIIPLSRSFDNSFMNKTLCYHEENRNVKKGKTPHEAYSGHAEKYEEILNRVLKFLPEGSRAAKVKLDRFRMDDLTEFEDFASRQLNDTRYASRLAADYVGLLYGGRTDEEGKLRVRVSRGQVTKFLRDEWGLNVILSDGGAKSRADHRHHAVDALVIALTEQGTIKMLSDAAAKAEQLHRRKFATIEPPWEGFLNDAHKAVSEVIVSHRSNRKVTGPLHEETIYSPLIQERDEDGQVRQCHHVRKPIENLTKNELAAIVDPKVKEAVLRKIADLGGGEPKKVFAKVDNHPCLRTKDGRSVPIHKVRIRAREKLQVVGSGHRQRHVALGSNHHVEIFETTDKKSRVKWDGEVVSMFEAHRRLKVKEPVVKRDHGPGAKFLFSLCGGDTIELDEPGGGRAIHVVRSLWETASTPRFHLVPVNDARRLQDIPRSGREPRLSVLEDRHCQKVIVTPLGEIRRAND